MREGAGSGIIHRGPAERQYAGRRKPGGASHRRGDENSCSGPVICAAAMRGTGVTWKDAVWQ
jgi:hypothetical protein